MSEFVILRIPYSMCIKKKGLVGLWLNVIKVKKVNDDEIMTKARSQWTVLAGEAQLIEKNKILRR